MTTARTLALYLFMAALGAGASLVGIGHADNEPKPEARPAAPSPAVSQANQLSDAFAQVAEKVSPSVVTIQIEGSVDPSAQPQLPFPFFGMQPQQQPQLQRGSGSGVVLRADGAILTNNHVVQNA